MLLSSKVFTALGNSGNNEVKNKRACYSDFPKALVHVGGEI